MTEAPGGKRWGSWAKGLALASAIAFAVALAANWLGEQECMAHPGMFCAWGYGATYALAMLMAMAFGLAAAGAFVVRLARKPK
jgi:hypothetical protein